MTTPAAPAPQFDGTKAQAFAGRLRTRMNDDPDVDPRSLFANVFAEPTPQLLEQREWLNEEIAADDGRGGGER